MTDSAWIRVALLLLIFAAGCTYKDVPVPVEIIVDCSKSTFAIDNSDKTNPSSCLSIDGSFTIHATGGKAPYTFSFDGASFQSDSTNTRLGPGTYLITSRDANGCEKSTSVKMEVAGSTLAASAVAGDDTECLTDNGSFTVTASGGTPPYTYQFGAGPQADQTVFSDLKSGYYTVVVRDDELCLQTLNVWVHRGETGTSFNSVIKPIFDTNCTYSGCHNGDNGASLNWDNLANVQKHATNIKTRTSNKTMPPDHSLTPEEISLIACWVEDGAKEN